MFKPRDLLLFAFNILLKTQRSLFYMLSNYCCDCCDDVDDYHHANKLIIAVHD